MLEVDEGSRLGGANFRSATKYGAPAVPLTNKWPISYDLARELLAAAGYEHYR